MTDQPTLDVLEAVARAATQGEWHHVNPGLVLPKTRTVHGPVPAERVDYVSTWKDKGTPPGHRVIVPMARDGSGVRSEDMAHIATFDPPTVLALIAAARVQQTKDFSPSQVSQTGCSALEGWKLVPVEPTEAMKEAAFGPIRDGGREGSE